MSAVTPAARPPVLGAAHRWAPRWRGPLIFAALAVLLLMVAPAGLSPFRLGLLAKYMCFAIVALGIALAWGRGGMLTLGQGVFFGLGGYAMGMYLKLDAAGPGQLPDFMVWSGVDTLPALWAPFRNAWFAVSAAVAVPILLATTIGLLVFRQRVRGAYFAILTQAFAAAFVILLVGQQGITGGTNGLTNFGVFFGRDLAAESTQRSLYLIAAVALGAAYLGGRHVVHSRFGRLLVAVRDGEDRVRFLGYDPAVIKTITFAASAGLAGLAGALFVPIVGIISPAMLGIVASLELLIGVAVGGRASLAGAAMGAIVVAYAKTVFSEDFPSGWLYLQGALFVVVMVFAPRGLAGLATSLRDVVGARWGRRRSTRRARLTGAAEGVRLTETADGVRQAETADGVRLAGRADGAS